MNNYIPLIISLALAASGALADGPTTPTVAATPTSPTLSAQGIPLTYKSRLERMTMETLNNGTKLILIPNSSNRCTRALSSA